MKLTSLVALLLCAGTAADAQLSTDQKLMDFQILAANFAKRYAPYEWKRAIFGVDALNIKPFLDRVAASRDDLEFYDICYDYVAQFHDAHVGLFMSSNFEASLGFTTDVYDDKVVIDSISRSVLPAREYPFEVGDELVSLDGKSAGELLQAFSKYAEASNARATRRFAAGMIPRRGQAFMPSAGKLGEKAVLVVRRRNGALETYEIPWQKWGVPLTSEGPVPSPKAVRRQSVVDLRADGDPDYFAGLRPLMYAGVRVNQAATTSVGALRPTFALPDKFQTRLGRPYIDYFFSGTYPAGGKTIGYIRIPDFEPDDPGAALAQFEREITYMQANSDGLVIDVMNNPGGYIDVTTEILRRVIPRPFRTLGFELRATAEVVQMFSDACEYADLLGAEPWQVAQCNAMLDEVRSAYGENRGRTGPLPLDFLFVGSRGVPDSLDMVPAADRNGRITGYSKPIVVLTNELSFSGADAFAAVMQDNEAGLLFGTRTAGAGGNTAAYAAGVYSETTVNLTRGLMVRKNTVIAPDFPATSYIENVGVRPDVEAEYQTLDNLINRGKGFVERFTAAILDRLQTK